MFLKNFIFGLIIGIGFIIPGVSGGVLATILGIYEKILDKISNLFIDFKKNITYLLPIFFGIFLSVLLLSKIILYLLNNNYIFISYVFMGLITGCIPFLLKEVKNKTNKYISIFPFILSFIFGLFLFIIQNNNFNNYTNPNFLIMITGGIIYSIGKIIPGISGAALLMLLGIYEYLLNIIANPFMINLNIIITLIPFFISFLISAIFIIKLINYLLKHYFLSTYSAIIGFILSSLLFIYPAYFSITYIFVFTSSFLISYYFSQ